MTQQGMSLRSPLYNLHTYIHAEIKSDAPFLQLFTSYVSNIIQEQIIQYLRPHNRSSKTSWRKMQLRLIQREGVE